MKSTATTVKGYLEGLPPERREAIEKVRQVILENLPEGYEEKINWGMLSYEIPLERYPKTYNKQPLGVAGLASQKNYMSLYLNGVYTSEDMARSFIDGYRASGKRLDMGKCCVRFRKIDDLPLDLIGETLAKLSPDQLIELFESARRHAKRE